MFTIVNMSKATLCNSLERVTEAVPKVQYSGHPEEASFVKTLHRGPGLKLIKGFLMSSIKTLVTLHQPPLVRHFSY